MWSSQSQHVDVFGVPPDVRDGLGGVLLPSSHFGVFALSSVHGVALTSETQHPYEVYVSWSSVRNRIETVRDLVESRDSHGLWATRIPAHADPHTTPVCRDVWTFLRGRPHRQVAMDILHPRGHPPQGIPMRAHVLLFDADDFGEPKSVQLHVSVASKTITK